VRARLAAAPGPETNSQVRVLADQAFARAAGAPLVAGNEVRLLKDAQENYPAWLEAIRSAERTVHFESYIVYDDALGLEFARVLCDRARAGVRTRVIHDWLGAIGKTRPRFWRDLARAGVEVRSFNPPRLDSPLGWLSRDHRKVITVDGRIAFVTGLCVGQMWVGDPARGAEPWRDTGVELRGPAVAAVERAFAQMWAACGEPIPPSELPDVDDLAPAGDVSLRVIASTPYTAGLYRLDQLIAAVARRTLWITDAYFVGTTTYVQGLCAAARDGVDVRLLVPGASDVPLLRPLSRAGYRPLLEAGVRVFEWNGTMLHAKTAVADGRWARVGSTNLNLANWIGNWELDVAVEDGPFAEAMARMYRDDLAHATEIVLDARRRVRPPAGARRPVLRGTASGSAGRVAAGALRIGHTVGAAITDHRALGPAEARFTAGAGLAALALAVVALLWPLVVSAPVTLLAGWTAAAMLVKAYRLHRDASRETEPSPLPQAEPAEPPEGGGGA
jgi:cardiolipin synthase A/B